MLKPGSMFANRYRIDKEIGRGGMGSIYQAHDTKINETVCLKLLLPDLQKQPDVIERFIQEIRLALKITHENVVRIYDIGEEGDAHFISMEYVKGQDLKDKITEQGHLSVVDGIEIMKQVCSGLAAAHAKGIVHRDMKPQNLLIDVNNNVKIVDFGIAKLQVDGATGMTKAGMVMGTPEYMSPEQALGQKIDHRTDIYSLGVIMFEVLTGELPFYDPIPMNILIQHIEKPPPTPSSIVNTIPFEIDRIIAKAMAKNRDQRFLTVDEFRETLERVFDVSTEPILIDSFLEENVDLEASTMMGELEVIEEISEEAEESGSQTESLYEMGMKLFKQRKYKDALNYFEKVIAADPNHALAYDYVQIAGEQIANQAKLNRLIALAEKAYTEKNYAVAHDRFKEALTINPNHPIARVGMRKVTSVYEPPKEQPVEIPAESESGDLSGAVSELKSLFEQGKKFYEQENYAEAVAVLEELLSKEPGHVEGSDLHVLAKAAQETKYEIEHHFLTARRLYKDGDYEAARQELEITLDYKSDHEEARKLYRIITGEADEDENEGDQDAQKSEKAQFNAFLRQVQKLLKEKKFDESIAELEKAKKTFPAKTDDLDQYIGKINSQIEKNEIQTLLKEAKQYLAEEKYRKAQATFQKILDVEPENPMAVLGMKKSREEIDRAFKQQELMQTKKIQLQSSIEREDFVAARKRKKNLAIAGIVLIVLIVISAAMFTQIGTIKGKLSSYYRGKALVLYQQRQYDDAVLTFEKAAQWDPAFSAAAGWAESLYYAKSFNRSLAMFQQLIQEDGDKAIYHFFIAKCYEALKNGTKAIEEYKKSIAMEPDNESFTGALGMLYLTNGNTQAAATYLLRSLSVKPNQPQVRMQLAEAYENNSQYNDAIAQYKILTRENASFELPFTRLAALYLKIGQYNACIEVLNKISKSGGTAENYYLMGQAYEKRAKSLSGGDWKKSMLNASDYFRKSFVIDMTYNDVVHDLLRVLQSLGERDRAIQVCEQYLGEHQSDDAVHLALGVLYKQAKKYGPAYDSAKKAVNYNPQNSDAWKLMAQISDIRGDTKDAKNAWKKYRELK